MIFPSPGENIKWSWCSSRVTFTMKIAITARMSWLVNLPCLRYPPQMRPYWELINHWFPLKGPYRNRIESLFLEGGTRPEGGPGWSAEVRTQCTCSARRAFWGSGSISKQKLTTNLSVLLMVQKSARTTFWSSNKFPTDSLQKWNKSSFSVPILLGTNISPPSRHFWVDDFPFQRWDTLAPWRVWLNI